MGESDKQVSQTSEVQELERDDKMLDLVSRGHSGEGELSRILAAWRLEIAQFPRCLVDTDLAIAIIRCSHRSKLIRLRRLLVGLLLLLPLESFLLFILW